MTTRIPVPVPVDTPATAPITPLDRAPAPVPVAPTAPVLRSPPERVPAPVSPIADPELPQPRPSVTRAQSVEPEPAPDPYPEQAEPIVVPEIEQPVPEPPVEPDENIIPDTSRYITVSEDGVVVLVNATTLNFVGSAVQVTGNDSVATITVTSAAEYGNANVVSLLASFGTNSISTTGNVTASVLSGSGSGLSALPWANVTGAPAFITAANLSVITGTASGNGSLSYNNTTGVFSFTPADASLSQYGDANVVSLLAGFGSNNVSTTGNITAGNFSVAGNSITWNNASITQTSAEDLAITGDGQVSIRSLDGTYQWTFGNNSNLTFPSNGQIVMDGGDATIGNQSDDFVISWDNEEIRLVSVQGSIEMQADNAFRVQTNYDGGTDTYLSRWEFNQDEIVNITGPSALVTEAGNLMLSGGRDGLASGNVSVVAVNNGVIVNTWNFDNTGNLTLPHNGNLVGTTANNNGYITWLGNSSGDGNGYTTLNLVPDDTLTGTDQYLILDPTAPGHIHIRAGGTQDASSADLFLGGENSYFKVAAGANSDAVVGSNGNTWTFDTLGILTLPGEGVLRSIGDTVTLQSLDIGTGNANSVYLGSSGGLGFFDQDIGGNWLEIFRSGTEPEIRVPVDRGNLTIQTAQGENSYNWVFDDTGNLTAPGNVTASTFIGNISVTGNVTGTTPNVTLIAGSYSWTFDNTGNLQGNVSFTGNDIVINNAAGGQEGAEIKWALPAPANTTLNGQVIQDVYQNGMRFFESGGTSRGLYIDMANAPAGAGTAVGYRDIPQVSFTGDATIAATDAGKHYYSTLSTGNTLTIANNTSVSWSVGTAITVVNRGTGNITVAQDTGVSLYLAGNSTAGNRIVSTYGMATLLNVAANVWMINGTGVS